MSFEFDAAGFRLYDGATLSVDSARQNMVGTDLKTGSFVIPQITNPGGAAGTVRTTLGAVNANATHVFGMLRATYTSAVYKGAITHQETYSLGGTTLVDAVWAYMDPAGNYQTYYNGVAAMCGYIGITFLLVGGNLVVDVHRFGPYVPNDVGDYPFYPGPITINYWALCVTFDN